MQYFVRVVSDVLRSHAGSDHSKLMLCVISGALSSSEVADGLQLHKMTGRKWFVQATCAHTGEGLYEGIDELARYVKEFKAIQRSF